MRLARWMTKSRPYIATTSSGWLGSANQPNSRRGRFGWRIRRRSQAELVKLQLHGLARLSGCTGRSRRLARRYLGLDLRVPFIARCFEVKLGLHADPIAGRRVEVAGEPQGGFPGD